MDPKTLLQNTITERLEDGQKGGKFPRLQYVLDNIGDDLKAEEIVPLREEIAEVDKAFMAGMAPLKDQVTVMVGMHDTDYSPLFGIPVSKDAWQIMSQQLNGVLDQCDLALELGCGFGRFSANPDKIQEAQKKLRQRVEEFVIPAPDGLAEYKIVAFDSNNRLEEGRVADGMWVPYRTIGLVRRESDGLLLGFRAEMDYGSGEWSAKEFSREFLSRLTKAGDVVGLSEAYQKICDKDFADEDIRQIDEESLELLKNTPSFRHILARVSNRWLN